eukprot:CAMPEP_0114607360 /NCGR_PEP_ID=MMETSP0168-20121206/2029_1 /TAXON_ID=95228 ORGANISM="Vannella sp., Strain DIVA3 517/6/12" /NCGR_SAMPLE_ID=MMETSP0168 /ASSEMBLY_ACC=CAM_ASM_000044 /LENGTH=44 /DNA_ID= /DNA_START= /DNA_END= /DNA_ORIENTATION=
MSSTTTPDFSTSAAREAMSAIGDAAILPKPFLSSSRAVALSLPP